MHIAVIYLVYFTFIDLKKLTFSIIISKIFTDTRSAICCRVDVMDDSSKAIFSTDVNRPVTSVNNMFVPKPVSGDAGLSMFTTVPDNMRPPHHSTCKQHRKTPNVEEEASKLESKLDTVGMKSDPGTEDGIDHRRESGTEDTAKTVSNTQGDIAEKRALNQEPKSFGVKRLQSDGSEFLSSTSHVPSITVVGWEYNRAFVAKGDETSMTPQTPQQQRPFSVNSFD